MPRVKLHIKTVGSIENRLVERQIARAKRIYEDSAVGINLDFSPVREALNIPHLEDVDIGQCAKGQLTSEQLELFQHRNNAGPEDVVVYFVQNLSPHQVAGCANHPDGLPALVIQKNADRHVLSHELGHVFGLDHVDDTFRLMYRAANWDDPPPDISPIEVARSKSSPLVV